MRSRAVGVDHKKNQGVRFDHNLRAWTQSFEAASVAKSIGDGKIPPASAVDKQKTPEKLIPSQSSEASTSMTFTLAAPWLEAWRENA